MCSQGFESTYNFTSPPKVANIDRKVIGAGPILFWSYWGTFFLFFLLDIPCCHVMIACKWHVMHLWPLATAIVGIVMMYVHSQGFERKEKNNLEQIKEINWIKNKQKEIIEWKETN